MTRRLFALVLVCCVVLSAVVAAAGAAGTAPHQETPRQETPSTQAEPASQAPSALPRPNAGVAPANPGDRGGSQQSLVFFLVCGAIVGLGGLAYLDAKRGRRRAAASART